LQRNSFEDVEACLRLDVIAHLRWRRSGELAPRRQLVHVRDHDLAELGFGGQLLTLLVFATGAGASARKSIGITVFSGMLASTCLAVLFVPSFFVVIQRFEEWRRSRKKLAEPLMTTPRSE